jgi:hypothetical protein
MRSGTIPVALLFLALGLALASAPRQARVPSVLVLVATSALFSCSSVPRGWLDAVFLGCLISVIGTAASVHLVGGLGARAALVLSLNAGMWAGAVISVSGSSLDLLAVLPCLSIAIPASWVVRRHASIPVKVVSSWLVAVAVLAITLYLLPVSAGYLPDHME